MKLVRECLNGEEWDLMHDLHYTLGHGESFSRKEWPGVCQNIYTKIKEMLKPRIGTL